MISDRIKDVVGGAILASGRRLGRLEKNGLMVEISEKLDAAPSMSDAEITRLSLEIISSLNPPKNEKGAVDHLGRPIEASTLNQRLLELSNLISAPDEAERVKAMWELRQLLTRNRRIL